MNEIVSQAPLWRDYLEMCKPRVVLLMLLCALVGMYLASPGAVPIQTLVLGLIGIGLVAGSAAVVNHNADAHIDARMARTRNRPLPSGTISPFRALIFGEYLVLGGTAILAWQVNLLTAFLAATVVGLFEATIAQVTALAVLLPVVAGQSGNTGAQALAVTMRGLALRGITLDDVDRRNNMVAKYDQAFGSFAQNDKILAGMDEFSAKAYQMMRSTKAREAFDLTKESAGITGMFDDQPFSQSCLLATRLVESGVKFVTLNLGGWDTHQDNWNRLKDRNLPALDAGLSGLFRALEEKGLLDSTSVFVTGEFGRTPKINQRVGRDHYPRAMFCLMAGGGMQGGQVIGASDAKGEGPKDRAISPDDVAASFMHSLGIDPTKEYHTPTGRPVMIVRDGTVIPELFS